MTPDPKAVLRKVFEAEDDEALQMYITLHPRIEYFMEAMTEYAMVFANSINDELNYALAEGQRLSETAKHWQQKSAEKDKEIERLKGEFAESKDRFLVRIDALETCLEEYSKEGRSLAQDADRELAAAKDRIAELEKEVNRLTMDNMTHEYNNAEAERFAPEHQRQIVELAQEAFEYALDNRFSRYPAELWQKFRRDHNL